MAPAAYNRRPSVLGPGGGFVDASESRILVCICVMLLAQEGEGAYTRTHPFIFARCIYVNHCSSSYQ